MAEHLSRYSNAFYIYFFTLSPMTITLIYLAIMLVSVCLIAAGVVLTFSLQNHTPLTAATSYYY